MTETLDPYVTWCMSYLEYVMFSGVCRSLGRNRTHAVIHVVMVINRLKAAVPESRYVREVQRKTDLRLSITSNKITVIMPWWHGFTVFVPPKAAFRHTEWVQKELRVVRGLQGKLRIKSYGSAGSIERESGMTGVLSWTAEGKETTCWYIVYVGAQ